MYECVALLDDELALLIAGLRNIIIPQNAYIPYVLTYLVPSPSETWFRGMSVGGSFRRV